MSDTEIKEGTKRLYIIRHGETDFNKKGIVQGRGVNSDLNENGRKQADAFFEAYKDLPFDKIYTSELKRTHQTVAKFLERGLNWEQLAGLDELAWGIYEGKETSSDIREGFEGLIRSWTLGDYNARIEGGESPNDVNTRQIAAMETILSKEEEKLVLICMHGRAMRLLLCQLMGESFSHMDEYPHQNTSLYILDYDGEKFEMKSFNSLSHLK